MLIKVFTTDRDGKITLTAKELKQLLDEAYWEGYRNNNHSWTYTTPSWSPFYYTTTGGSTTISLSNEATSNSTITSDQVTINGNAYNSPSTVTCGSTYSGCTKGCGSNK